jgi:hypothetical protein
MSKILSLRKFKTFIQIQNFHLNLPISVATNSKIHFLLFSSFWPKLPSRPTRFFSLFTKAVAPLGLWASKAHVNVPLPPDATSRRRPNGLALPRPASSRPPTCRCPLLSQVGDAQSLPLLLRFSPESKWPASMPLTTSDRPASCLFISPEPPYKRCHTSAALPRAHLCYQLHSSPCRHSSHRAPLATTIPHLYRPFSTVRRPLSFLSLLMQSRQ